MAGPRLTSIDLLRGAAIVGMVLINNPAVGPPYLFGQLTHARWEGWTFADTVFPVFLFVVGAVLSRRSASVFVRRAVILFGIGLALNTLTLVLAGDPFARLRIMGVLQRIAVAGLLAAVIIRRVPRRSLLPVAVLLLLATWAALSTMPLTRAANLPGWIDRHVLGVAHMYRPDHGNFDPEGLFGCVPAAAGVLIGAWAGDLLRAGRVWLLALCGAGFVLAGEVWAQVLPISKPLWTPSYVVLMSGVAMLALVVGVGLGRDGPLLLPLRMIGANPLVVFVGSEATGIALSAAHHGKLPFSYWVWSRWLQPEFGGRLGALAWAVAILAVWWGVAAVMWRRRWFVRV
ncbi:MAG: acyltransferase family protein [Acidimicrobiales bacterium]